MATRRSKATKKILGYIEAQQDTLLGYRRKSMVRDDVDLVSPERQAKACEMWVEMREQLGEKGYAIEWYEDVDGHRSGRDIKGRSGLQELLTQLGRPDVAGVIVDSLDRLYRNVSHFLTFLDRLEQLGKRLIIVKEQLDTQSNDGRTVVTILMTIYQWEANQTSERMIRNVTYKREVLGRHWGPTPFGCDRNDDGQLIPTARQYWLNTITSEAKPESAGLIEGWELRRFHDGLIEVYKAYATGLHSYGAVADIVNDAGWRYYADSSGTPKLFNQDSIRRIISFWRLYRGELPLGNITNTSNPTILPGGHDPIVPVELCNQAGIVKEKRGRGSGNPAPGQPQRIYIVSDVAFCAVCGKSLKGQYQDGKRIYRHYGGKKGCPEKWLMADEIETDAIELMTALSSTDLLAAVVEEAERLAQEAFAGDEKNYTLLTELARQKRRLDNLEEMRLDGDIDKERYRLRKAEIDVQITTIEDKLYAASQVSDIGPVISRITATLSRLRQATPETKKTLINSVIERLEIGGGQVLHLKPRPWSRPFF